MTWPPPLFLLHGIAAVYAGSKHCGSDSFGDPLDTRDTTHTSNPRKPTNRSSTKIASPHHIQVRMADEVEAPLSEQLAALTWALPESRASSPLPWTLPSGNGVALGCGSTESSSSFHPRKASSSPFSISASPIVVAACVSSGLQSAVNCLIAGPNEPPPWTQRSSTKAL